MNMRAPLNLVEHNLREIRVDNARMLFHVPTSALFALDALTGSLIDRLRAARATGQAAETLIAQLLAEPGSTGQAEDIEAALRELLLLEIVSDGGTLSDDVPSRRVDQLALSTIVLNVNTGCNLNCAYCYKEDLDKPSAGKKMSKETAINAIELLLAESPQETRYNVVFFGGEPLSHPQLIRDVVDYCEPRFGELGKTVDFSLTTNGTLLTDTLTDWLDTHRFGLSISMDGPEAIHDRNRVTIGGHGSYATVRAKAERLLSRYRSRPVGARVTLTHGTTEVERIWDHLFNDLGFAEVGFAPVTAGDIRAFDLAPAELAEVFAGFKRLGQRYLAAAQEGRNIGFSNLHQLLTKLHEGHKASLPCGAGMKMLAVDHAGDLNLCHRFTGSSLPAFGNVRAGVAHAALGEFLARRLEREGTGCATCSIRNLCSGGCYHESYARYGDPTHPVYHYCELMRDWVDFGIETYARIMTRNPAFIDLYLSPRRLH
ncbi:thioether cross-link-forming SCIFF peptide maturase [Betaproteobacteria bacterium]|nr:thioether cross-link-forming SCIFF peptide maturase [Betaproteobacteria bacterium]